MTTRLLPKRKVPAESISIALLSWESMYSISVGGLASHVTELAAALSHRGHEVHLFTRMGPGQSRYDCIAGVHYHRCPFDPKTDDFVEYVERMGDSFVQHLNRIEQLIGPFDVIHGHDWLSTHALRRIKNEFNRLIVFTIHSTEYGRCGNQLHDGDSTRVRHLEWEGAYVSDRIICVSETLRQEVRGLYAVPLDKMTVIYNGVNPRRFEASINIESVRQRYEIGPNDPTVLFAGRLTRQKGPDLLVEAIPDILSGHPQTKFIFAGDGDMRRSLEDRTRNLGITEATRFVGHHNGLELISLFKCVDAVCVPSRNEPFGIVILEAWSAGKPVIVTRSGGPAEFVRHQDTGILVSVDRSEIGLGVREVLGQMDHGQRIGREGRLLVESQFSWGTIAAETERIYLNRYVETASKGDPTTQESSDVATVLRAGKPATLPPTAKTNARDRPERSQGMTEIISQA